MTIKVRESFTHKVCAYEILGTNLFAQKIRTGMRLNMDVLIREMKKSDWETVREIYKEGIQTKIATFQTELPSYEEWNNAHLPTCRLVAVIGEAVIGWTALSLISSRCVYRGVAEVSIYIKAEYRGNQVGVMLLQELFKESEKQGYWTLQSGILEINHASISLHKKVGFRMIGYREKIAKDSDGVWQNTVLMERRSNADII